MKKEEWRELAVTAASMRAAHRLTKEIPGVLTKALQPMTERRVFYKHSVRKRAPSMATAGELEDKEDDDSEEEVQMSVLDVMQSSMSEALLKRKGQHALLGLLFDMIKSEHDPMASFVGLLETDAGECRRLRVTGALGGEIDSLIGVCIEEKGTHECFGAMDAGVIIIQDTVCPSLPEEFQSEQHSWLLVPIPKRIEVALDDTVQTLEEPIGLICIAIPRREPTTVAMMTAVKPEVEEGEEEEEDEEQILHNEMLESLKTGAQIFGSSLTEAWQEADEPQLHRSTVRTAQLVDDAMERLKLTFSTVKSLCAAVANEVATTMQLKTEGPVSWVVGLKDPNTELLMRCVHSGPHWAEDAGHPSPLANSKEDLVWEVLSSECKFQIDMLPRSRTVCGLKPQPSKSGAPVASLAALGIPLMLNGDDETKQVIGAITFLRDTHTLEPGSEVYAAERASSGFSKDEVALAEMAAGPLAQGCEAGNIREQVEQLLKGLIRKFCQQHEGGPAPLYEAPAVFKFKRQTGATSQEVTLHSDCRGVLKEPRGEEHTAVPVRPELGTSCSIVFGAEAGDASTQQLDEVKSVCTIALTHICNRNHRPLLQVQHKAVCVQRWMLCAEALLEFHRLQLGRITEAELLELEPRQEPPKATSLMVDAILLLVGHQTSIDMLSWKHKRVMLGAPLVTQLIDLDPTRAELSQNLVRPAVSCWKQAGALKDQLCAAGLTLYEWMGAVLWARKEMRAIAYITRQASLPGLVEAMATGDKQLVQAILSVDGFDMTAVDDEGNTVLHHVATALEGDAGLTELLLSERACQAPDFLGARNSQGNAVLHMAISLNRLDMLQQLLGAGADVEQLDSAGNPPLVLAASRGVGVVQMLLDAGADVNAETSTERTLLDLCRDNDEMEHVKALILAAGAQTSAATQLLNRKESVEDSEVLLED